MKKMMVMSLLLFCSYSLLAQEKAISGVVTSAVDGQPIPGASVIVEGTTIGTTTDFDGNYVITVPNDQVSITFRYLGFAPQTIAVDGQRVINVVLAEDLTQLSEVVIVGYGTQKKENLTGAVAAVGGDVISNKPQVSALDALQGEVAGVTISQFSGEPGNSEATIRIRGIGTFGVNDPLVIIDGNPGGFNDVDPNTIESISVLKDAASASIYGSRAANGVVLITTKRAKGEKMSITYNGYVGVQRTVDDPKFLGAVDFMNLHNEALVNEGNPPLYEQDFIDSYAANHLSDPDNFPDTDWQDLAMKSAPIQQQHTISVSGGSEKMKVLGSMTYQEQDGLVANSSFERYAFRLNTDVQFSEAWNFKFDTYYQRRERVAPGVGIKGLFQQINRVPPIFAGLHSDGTYGEGWNGSNPLAWAESAGLDQRDNDLIQLNLRTTLELLEGLNFEVGFAPKLNYLTRRKFTRSIDYLDWETKDVVVSNPLVTKLDTEDARTFETNWRALLRYNKDLGEHSLNLLAGFEKNYWRYDETKAFRDGFPIDDLSQLNSGSAVNQTNSGSAYEVALRSFFGRVNYSYKNKYLLEGNLRRDESSRFRDGQRVGYFPSASVGWRISEEAFFNSSFINELKLRGSWGQLGNQNVFDSGNRLQSSYPYISIFDINQSVVLNNTENTAGSLITQANADISWETSTQTNIGLDLTMFNNRFSLTADYFIRNTDDILLQLPVPATQGFAKNPFENAAEVENKGYEIAANYKGDIGEDFTFRLGVNFSDVKNEILDLKDRGPFFPQYRIREVGGEFNALFGYEADGLFQTQEEVDAHATQFGTVAPGDIKYVDQNGDGLINDEDRVVIGSRVPRNTYSFNIDFGYKGFSLNTFWQGVGKWNGYQTGDAAWAFSNAGKVQERHLDRWTPDNPDASYPRFFITNRNNSRVSSFWVTDASFLKLKNVSLSYDFPRKVMEKTFLQSLRLFVTGQNVLSFDDMEGYDPEAPLGNADYYPQVSVYTLGVNASF